LLSEDINTIYMHSEHTFSTRDSYLQSIYTINRIQSINKSIDQSINQSTFIYIGSTFYITQILKTVKLSFNM